MQLLHMTLHNACMTLLVDRIRKNLHGLAWALAWLVLALFWWQQLSPKQLPDVSSPAAQPFDCISYSPFRFPDLNPFNYQASVSEAQIEADLRQLLPLTNCVRTYGLAQGLDQVPAVAQRLGMRVKLGVWITREAAHNERELAKGLALASAYLNTIDLLIVGNEVLLRRELTTAQLAAILTRAKAASAVPVSYADVWEFWQRHSALGAHVDVITLHILPYWEDHPVGVADAAQYVQSTARAMQAHFSLAAPGKALWIGETGWPSQGRQRGPAVAGVPEQTRFVREMVALKPSIGMPVNLIEAFDQPWKRSFEGAMGGAWGLFDAAGKQRVSLRGPVAGDALGANALLAMSIATLLAAVLTRFSSGAQALMWGSLVGIGFLQWRMSMAWDRTLFEHSVSIALAALGLATTLVCTVNTQALKWERLRHGLHLAMLLAAASAALILLLDPRYRPMPWWWFFCPCVALLMRCWMDSPQVSRRAQFLAGALLLASLGFMLREGWHNAQALGYGVLLVALAATALPAPARSRTQLTAASNAAGAAN